MRCKLPAAGRCNRFQQTFVFRLHVHRKLLLSRYAPLVNDCFESRCWQGCSKRLLGGGTEASPYWGGSTNPDGSKKKIAKYTTKEEKTSRKKQTGKLRTQRKDEVRKRFLQRRIAAETNGKWSGPRKFEEWLLGMAERVLGGDSIEDTTQVRAQPAYLPLSRARRWQDTKAGRSIRSGGHYRWLALLRR